MYDQPSQFSSVVPSSLSVCTTPTLDPKNISPPLSQCIYFFDLVLPTPWLGLLTQNFSMFTLFSEFYGRVLVSWFVILEMGCCLGVLLSPLRLCQVPARVASYWLADNGLSLPQVVGVCSSVPNLKLLLYPWANKYKHWQYVPPPFFDDSMPLGLSPDLPLFFPCLVALIEHVAPQPCLSCSSPHAAPSPCSSPLLFNL